MRANLDNQEETKRFNGPKSVVGPFDKIRRAGKARRVESLSFSKNRYENFMKFSQHLYLNVIHFFNASGN